MSLRLNCAFVLGLAIIASPLVASSVLAQTPPPPTANALQTTISNAARAAAAQPGFARLSPAQKLAAIQAAVTAAMTDSGASPTVVAAALVQAVSSGAISAGVAIQVASTVSPQTAQAVAQAPAVTQQLADTGQSAVVTASTNSAGAPTVLVSLQGAAAPSGGVDPQGGATATNTPAPFDPCAGVIAAYCGG